MTHALRASPLRCVAALIASLAPFVSAAAAAADAPPPAPSATPAPASDAPDMSAPGRSSVPAPAFESAPRRQRPNDFSSQNMAIEFRFGPYAPRVDESDGLTPPQFKPFFGTKTRFQVGAEVDWQIWRAPHVGTLGVGVGWSITKQAGANKLPDGQSSDIPIEQETTFTAMPMYGVGVLRVDVLAREFGVPLVGYGKFGLAYALWWINDGLGTATFCDANNNCVKGKDDSVGTQAALGAMLQLDWLEPSAGVELDNSLGINNSYLFFEWSVSNYPGKQMNVGANTWVTGLAFEM